MSPYADRERQKAYVREYQRKQRAELKRLKKKEAEGSRKNEESNNE